jgi:hypothetical protein
MEPERCGPYLLLRLLARGGMGELFLAKRADGGRRAPLVVVKRILPELIDQPDFTAMFLSEGRIATLIEHPNVVRVHELGEEAGTCFMCMEYVAGKDLGTALRRLEAPLELPLALLVMREVCAGIGFAHDAVGPDGIPLHIVHRDINPYNILVSYSGEVKITDFGVAKARLRDRQQTRHGVLKGKLGYLSPEQARGLPVDQRSDIYLLGLVLFELTTGRQAIAGRDAEMLTLATQARVPRPRAVDRRYPPALEQIVLRAVARDPAHRYQSAWDLQRDLRGFEAEHGLAATAGDLAAWMKRLFAAEHEESREVEAPFIYAARADDDPLAATAVYDPSLPVGAARPAVPGDDLAPRLVTADLRPSRPRAVRATPSGPAPRVEPALTMPGLRADETRSLAVDELRATGALGPRPQFDDRTALIDELRSTVEDEPVFAAPPAAPQPEVPQQPAVRAAPRRARWVPRVALAIGLLGLAILVYAPVSHEGGLPPLSPDGAPRASLRDAGAALRAATDAAPRDSRAATASRDWRGPAPRDSTVLAPDTARASARELVPVSIACTPRVTVYWRGDSLGSVPLLARLPPGRHVLVLQSREPLVQTTRELTVTRGGRTSARFELGRGKLDLRVRPWAEVEIDGVRAGTTPMSPLELWEGRHDVRLFNPKLNVERRVRVVVRRGRTTRLVRRFGD